MSRPTLRPGCLAYLELSPGLLAVRVKELPPPPPEKAFDLLRYGISVSWMAKVEVREDRHGYRRGEVIEVQLCRVFPRAAFSWAQYGYRVAEYSIEPGSPA